MNKIDIKLEMKHLYQASAKAVVQVTAPYGKRFERSDTYEE